MYFYVINNNLMKEKEKHWEKIYETKKLDGVSWFQKKPLTSLSLIEISNINKDAEIIDVGCGKSFLIDNLLEKKYSKVSLLDISNNALKEVKSRTKNFPNSGIFYNSDILDFKAKTSFDLWHDRAVFHFLTKKNEINKYINICEKQINKNDHFWSWMLDFRASQPVLGRMFDVESEFAVKFAGFWRQGANILEKGLRKLFFKSVPPFFLS